MSANPAISVAVPSHDRATRLLWLLNALAEQELDATYEVVVVHDSRDETAAVLEAHPLAARGVLRAIEVAPCGPAPKRNEAWRAARAPLVAFTDDDCRPPRDWLARLLEHARLTPGAVVQGATRADPDEVHLLERVAHARTTQVEPPGAWGQTCNILYPRDLLERLGGFDESFAASGDDTDLLQRALAAGAPQVAAPDAVTFHMVETRPLGEHLRGLRRWEDVPGAVKRHPHLRAGMPLRIFWKTRHAKFALALAGLALARRFPPAALLALPWLREALPAYGGGWRGLARAATELPGRAAVDAVEISALARGSARHRTLLL